MSSRILKKACCYTLGCRLNHAETGLIAERLDAAGYLLVEPGNDADLCVINTCTVTAEADAKSRKMIRAFIRRNPNAFVAVVGCYSQLDAATIAGIPGVDLVIGNAEKLDVLDYVREEKNRETQVVCREMPKGDFTVSPAVRPAAPPPLHAHRPNLKIQEGCDSMCSYCVVPRARGRQRSREMANLLDEARALMTRGAREIVLSGINVGAYHYDGRTILDVLDHLDDLGVERVRISSIELTTLPDGLFERMNDASHALTPFLHVPLQSGSDAILRAMNRPYTRAAFAAFLERADAAVEDLCIGTDIMVGFPGETESDFDLTMSLLRDSALTYAHVFKFSERKGTRAARMSDKVDARTANFRSETMRQISERKQKAFHERFLGRTLEVLFEQHQDGFWEGHTRNYICVRAQSDKDCANALVPVRLCEARESYVFGTIDQSSSVFPKLSGTF
jgi:threonylcarbamoyladenosine tRNA methylthiotransferase MtaB